MTATARKSRPARNGRPAELLDRAPPADVDAERMVLRAMILDRGATLDAADLTADHFHADGHRKIFAALAALRENLQPIDVAHLARQLQADGGHDEIGGAAYLADLLSGEPLPALTAHYLGAVRDGYARRLALSAALETIQAVHGDAATADVVTAARQRFDDIGAAGLGLVRPPAPIDAAQLIVAHPHLRPPVIDGLLRRGETANIIAPPKTGKSWLSYGLALSVVTGAEWLGRFGCQAGRVLLVDNELHAATLAHRLRTVADAMAVRAGDYADRLTILPLRGALADLHGIAAMLGELECGSVDLIVLDAFYRALPAGDSENDNAAVAAAYNLIDTLTNRLGCAWINVHHSSKGSQAEKSVTDVGAGAGAQSRAADTHIILRQHDEPGAVVLEAVVRSFGPVDPLPLRWTFPVWQTADDLDPARLRGRLTRAEQRQIERDASDTAKLLDALRDGLKTSRALRTSIGAGPERCSRLLDALESDGRVAWDEVEGRGGKQRRYQLANAEETELV